MFRARGFIFRKTVVHTAMVSYVLHAFKVVMTSDLIVVT